jgi:glutathione S-transferase
MALTLYHVSWCPECAVVRDKLDALNLTYEDVIVPDFRQSRQEVFDASGQYYVPVLKDDGTVLTETREILAHLDRHYGGEGQDNRQDASGDGEDDAPCCSL